MHTAMSQLHRKVARRILQEDGGGQESPRVSRSASLPGWGLTPELFAKTVEGMKWTPSDVAGIEVRCVLGGDGTWSKQLRVCVEGLDWGRYCDSVDALAGHVRTITAALRHNTNANLAAHVFDQLADFNFDLGLHLRVVEAVARLKFQRDHRHRTSLTVMAPQYSVGPVRVKYMGEGVKPSVYPNKK